MTVPDEGKRSLAVDRIDWRHLCGAAVLALALAVAAVAVPGAVLAQEQPGEPVNIYGDAGDELGNAAQASTTIYAVVDGEVEDTIAVGENGQFGGNETFDDKLAVNSGAGETVTFTVDSPEGTVALDTVNLTTADGVVEISLTFPGASFAEIDVGNNGNLAGDTIGDGLLNDVDGDGEFDIFDVQALFNNLDSDAVQNNPAAFNFNGDENPSEVTIFDVQGLFELLD